MPPNPPCKAHGVAMRSMSLRDMQISKSEKKSWPRPLPNPGYAPDVTLSTIIEIDWPDLPLILYWRQGYSLDKSIRLLSHLSNI